MAKEKTKKKGKSWDQVDPVVGQGSKFDVALEIFSFNEEYQQIRLLGDVYDVSIHWIPTLKKTGTPSAFPRLCLRNLDDGSECPYCKARINRQTLYLSNAIIRELQDDEPRNKVKPKKGQEWKDPKDKVWTPIRVVQFPTSIAAKIVSLTELNKVKDKKTGKLKTYPVSHDKFGRDILVKKDTAQAGGNMYDIQREDMNRLTDDELDYLTYNIEDVFNYIESYEQAIETISIQYRKGLFDDDKKYDIKDICEVIGIFSKKKKKSRDDDEDEDEDDDNRRSSKKKKSNKKKKSKYDDDDDLEDLDDDDEDDDDEDDDDRRKKSNKKKKSKYEDDDDEDLDDDDEDDDLDDEDDDDDRRKKKKSNKKKKSKYEDDDDEDDDLDDDEDDEDEDLDDDDEDDDDEDDRRKKKKKKSNKKKKSKYDDEDDDLDDDDEDDEDLDDDDDDDDDDDEDDRRSSKKKKKSRDKDDDNRKKKKKSSKKRK